MKKDSTPSARAIENDPRRTDDVAHGARPFYMPAECTALLDVQMRIAEIARRAGIRARARGRR